MTEVLIVLHLIVLALHAFYMMRLSAKRITQLHAIEQKEETPKPKVVGKATLGKPEGEVGKAQRLLDKQGKLTFGEML